MSLWRVPPQYWALPALTILGLLLHMLAPLSGFVPYTSYFLLNIYLNATLFLVLTIGLTVPLGIAAAGIWVLFM